MRTNQFFLAELFFNPYTAIGNCVRYLAHYIRSLIVVFIILISFSAVAESKIPSMVLYDFEGNLSDNFPAFLQPETDEEFVKEGTQSGKWENLSKNRWLIMKNFPADWSSYDTLVFWIYSEKATGEKMSLDISSDENETTKGNYYYFKFIINWSGWRRFTIPFAQFAKSRAPAGWHKITQVTLYPGAGASAETILYLDNFELSRSIEPPGRLTGLKPDSALTIYVNAEEVQTGEIKFRTINEEKPTRIMYRLFDPDENLVIKKYIIMSNTINQSPIVLKEKMNFKTTGVYQIRVTAGCRNALVDIDLPEKTDYGISFQNGEYRSWPKIPEKLYAYIPQRAEKLFLSGGPLIILDENGKELFNGKKSGSIDVVKKDVVWTIIPSQEGVYSVWGFPFIICNTKQTAEKIKASIHVLDDGTVVSWKFQDDAHKLIKKYANTVYVGRNEDLAVDFRKFKDTLLKDPVENVLLLNNRDGLLAPVPAIINGQNLNPNDHWCGAIDMWKTAMTKSEPKNRWDRLHIFCEGLHNGSAGYKLALSALLNIEVNPFFGKKELLYRAALAGLRDITFITESEIALRKAAEMGTYPGSMAFLMPRLLHSFAVVCPHMPEDIQKVWIRGLQHVVDRHLPEGLVSCQNQSAHYITGFYDFYKGSRIPEYKNEALRYAKYFIDGASQAGWQPENIGPCGYYNGISHWYMGRYWRESGDINMRDALKKSYNFFNHTVVVEPNHDVIAGFNFNHRVTRGFNYSGYNGARGIADDIPEIGAWANTGKIITNELRENAILELEATLTNIPRTLEEASIGALSYTFHAERYLYAQSLNPTFELPSQEKEFFIRNIGEELIAVKQPGYFVSIYAGKPKVFDVWYIRTREQFRKVREGEENEGKVSTYQATPMIGGGMTIFSVPEFGSAIVAANWTPYSHHGLIAFIEDKRYWEDYAATVFTLNEADRKLVVSGKIEAVPVTYVRTYIFNKDALEVSVVLTATADVKLVRLFENIPVILGASKENGSEIMVLGEEKSAKGLTITDKNENGAQILFRQNQTVHTVRNGIKDRGLHLGRVEILFPEKLLKGESTELSYSLRAVKKSGVRK